MVAWKCFHLFWRRSSEMPKVSLRSIDRLTFKTENVVVAELISRLVMKASLTEKKKKIKFAAK